MTTTTTHERQIISIDLERESMVLHKERLQSILDKVPEGMKVGIVSVVGAFRMGKSFLLDLMLHYLHYMADKEGEGWTATTGTTNDARNVLEGSANLRDASGFSWRSGFERQTTGIWMWSEVFVRTSKRTGERIAMLLMDTQGMFDGEISQQLTTHIFGVSTLLSSYQIYNVSRQIQEDNMEHLALFAEYGKLAVGHGVEKAKRDRQAGVMAASGTASKVSKEEDIDVADDDNEDDPEAPFQRLDFLIRDWQNFDDEDDVDGCLKSMPSYLQSKLEEKEKMADSLRGTRAQIASSFRKLGCFLLPFPGKSVTKKTFDGNLNNVDEAFLRLSRVYFDRIFSGEGVFAKNINDRDLTAHELYKFAVQYVNLFAKPARWQREIKPDTDRWEDLPIKFSDALLAASAKQETDFTLDGYRVKLSGRNLGSRCKIDEDVDEKLHLVHVFPEAHTLLEATAYVCNLNAKEAGYKTYKKLMDRHCGADRPYVGVKDLEELHKKCKQDALHTFSGIATVGSLSEIQKHKLALVVDIDALYEDIKSANANKDPYKNIEFYLVPGAVGATAYVARVFSDVVCLEPVTDEFDFEWADVCTRSSSYFYYVYMAVFFFCVIIFCAKGHAAARYVKMIYGLVSASSAVTGAVGGKMKRE